MGTPADRDQVVASDWVGVTATQVPTFQWRWRPPLALVQGRVCGLPIDSAHPTLCIVHDPDKNKDVGRFNLALREKIEFEEADDSIPQIDLADVAFPSDADFRGHVFKKAVTFAGARFSRWAFFWDAQFGGDTVFGGVRFSGVVDFWFAQFGGSANFNVTGFPPQDSNAEVKFNDLPLEGAHNLRFEGVDLSRASFLRTDVRQVDLVGCSWAQKPVPLLWLLPIPWPRQRRAVIYDEVALDLLHATARVKEERRLVAELYRQLRLNLEASRQEAEADHFYVGQMEMRRQDPTYSRLYRWMLAAYRVLAMYGESYLRPPFFYLLFGAVFALAYLWGGFQVGQAPVKYDPWPPDWGQAGAFFKDSVRAYVQALTASGLFGANLPGGPMGASLDTAS